VADPRSNRALLDAADGWIAAALLARRECLATFDRNFVPLLPARQLVLLNP
jgi:hypothetical protein